jgi:hypothetical protein
MSGSVRLQQPIDHEKRLRSRVRSEGCWEAPVCNRSRNRAWVLAIVGLWRGAARAVTCPRVLGIDNV